VIVDDSDDNDKIYKGSFIIHSGADAVGYLHMKDGQTATITPNLDGDEHEGTAKITADYITALQDNIWTYSDPTYIVEETEFGDGDTVYVKAMDNKTRVEQNQQPQKTVPKEIQYPLTSPIVTQILSISDPS